jgi:two-component sensor histidine kinase
MGENLTAVDMRNYLHELGDTLLDAFGLGEEQVKIFYHLDPLRLDVDTAIPLGLIINELVTNSLKYAFPAGRTGVVEITLRQESSGKLLLRVADDGAGKAGAPTLKNSTSFGANLVDILSKKLDGKIEVSTSAGGYVTEICFNKFKVVN